MRTNGVFTTEEEELIVESYVEDPSDIRCPLCGPGTMEVEGFADSEGYVVSPGDEAYLVHVVCHGCHRGGGIYMDNEYFEEA